MASVDTSTALTQLSLTDASRRVNDRDVSPVELVEACLERIRATNELLCAYISIYEDRALEVARAAETMIAAGHRLGPLHGIPIAVKDQIGMAGLPTTAGSKVLADWRPEEDATVVAALKGAGAIVIGKTNQHEFAWGGTSANPHHGFVRNPWDPECFPAGSSGGSGAAVAAGTCYGSLGTDTGGSVRLPSAVNGIVGLRPTIGRVSNRGVIPLAWSMDTVGPMTRTAEDCAVMFGVIAGHDPNDSGTAPVPVDDYTADLDRGVTGTRIGVVPDYFFDHLQPAVHDAVRGALETLEGLGAMVIDVEIENIHGNISAQLTVESCEPSAYHQRWLRERPDDYGEDVRTLLELGEMHLATHYIQAQRYRALLRREFLDAFKSVDVFICPTLPFTATPIGATTVEIDDGVEEDMLSAIMQFTGVPSLTGLPSLNVPCGFDSDGLPVGMQIIGRPFDEAMLFRIGAAFQAETEFHTRHPVLDT
jgi:aspartyl-tRNA(Asn)/glutamyl-tRNA(Gln) amidotransferase subunit A